MNDLAIRSINLSLSVLKGEGFPVPVKKEKLKYRINTKFFGGNDELSEFYEGNTTGSYEFSIKKEYSAPANEIFLNQVLNENQVLLINVIKGEDKNAVTLGTTRISLLPFFENKFVLEDWYSVKSDHNSEKENARLYLKIELSEETPLISVEERENGHFMSVILDKLENVPRSWIPKTAVEDCLFEFSVAFPIPVSESQFQTYVTNGGRLQVASSTDSELKYIIKWQNATRYFFLSENTIMHLEKLCSQDEPIAMHLTRSIRADKFVEGYVDGNEQKYRGLAQFSIKKLLNPGIQELSSTMDVSHEQPSEQPVETTVKKPRSAQKKKIQMPAELQEEPADEVHPYSREGTTLKATITLNPPIIPLAEKRIKPSMKPSDLIPKREKVEKKLNGTEKYSKEIGAIVEILAEEYREIKSKHGNVDRQQFIFDLNNSGKYFTFKEKIKKTVVQIVKERFSREARSADQSEVEKFYNDLYVFLVQQMHVAINELFETASQSENVIIGIDGKPTDKWKRLADEAETEFNYSLASQHHQERVASNDFDPELWADYGTFSMRVNDLAKAEQAFREAIAIDLAHLRSLQMYGVLLCVRKQYKEAEVFLQASVDLDQNNYVSWGLLALYFELTDQMKQAHQTYLFGELAYKEYKKKYPTELHPKLQIVLANYLLSLHADALAEKVVFDEYNQKRSDTPIDLHMCFARIYIIREDYERAEDHLKSILQKQYRSSECWNLMGYIYFMQNRMTEAGQAYETAISVSEECTDPIILLRLGKTYIALGEHEKAKNAFLNAAKLWPCCISWLGVGISYLKLGDLVHAEQALNEANIQNNMNGEVWAYLAMLCAMCDRFEEAERSLREAVRTNCDRSLLEEVLRLFKEKDFPDIAF